jgi:hypothetical protein
MHPTPTHSLLARGLAGIGSAGLALVALVAGAINPH